MWVRLPAMTGILLSATASRPALGPIQPPVQRVPDALPPGVKGPGREADRSPPSTAEVKNVWSYTSTPLYASMVWCLVQQRDNLLAGLNTNQSRDSSVGIVLGYGLDDRGSRVRFPARAGNFFLRHRIQNGSGAHPASYLMGTRDSFPGGKAAGEWSRPLTSI
jgi:hypothetical protein